MQLRPWNKIPINENSDPLIEIPNTFDRLEPHPYLSLGAPYGVMTNPWILRTEVIKRLEAAQNNVFKANPEYKLAIFDAWRPIKVQLFMINHVINHECILRGIDQSKRESKEFCDLVDEVSKFWAPPSSDPSKPPPHSTGGAIDITLTASSKTLNMGSEIDELGAVSVPNYFHNKITNISSSASIFHSRRMLLKESMEKAGFIQHPNEWWHFSYGDQMRAWLTKCPQAFYGACSPVESNSSTF